jgi:Fur family ferric uptake transcriptional regulator
MKGTNGNGRDGAIDYEAYFHHFDLKNTRPRRLVLTVLIQESRLMTADDVHYVLRNQGESVNVSTVYRILDLFAKKGLVTTTILPDSRGQAYSLVASGHTHVLVCLRCHRKVDLSSCPLGEFEKNVASRTGFDILGHRLELYGLCRECRKETEGTTECDDGKTRL